MKEQKTMKANHYPNFSGFACCGLTAAMLLTLAVPLVADGAETLTLSAPQCAGMSGFRAQWDQTIPVDENGERQLRDNVVTNRGQTAVWGGTKPGPLAFDAVHRSLLVRFPDAGQKITEALVKGQVIAKLELVLPYVDEELWPPGAPNPDYPSADGYRFRMNWDVDKLYRANRPNWHAVAYALRKPWQADATNGPTFNAAIKDAVYWKRFGAADLVEDRFPASFGPAEVSSYQPEGRLDVTALVNDAAFGKTLTARLHVLTDCGFILNKQEIYDARFTPPHVYEWAISTGPRAILIKPPQLVVTFKPGKAEKVGSFKPVNVKALAVQHRAKPLGTPTAVVPSAAEVAILNAKFMSKPVWMPDWQFEHVRQLMGLESGGQVKPFYYRLAPGFVSQAAVAKAGGKDADYEVYLAWLDWVNGCPPRFWEGHLTAANTINEWYNFRDAMPAPVQATIKRNWTAWLMPDRETQLDPTLRHQYEETSGKLVHPMVDDPRVGKSKDGKGAVWNQGDTYYKLTGDWRGNKTYYRSGFTREMSTANFNSSASSGALLCGQIIGSERAMADGRAGLMQFPFWLWTHNAGVGQEYIDHYYWAIATAGNKSLADFSEQPEDKMAGWSIMTKLAEDLGGGYHPNLKKLIGPASRTYYEHVLGQQDGLYHILHVLSPKGSLSDIGTSQLEALSAPTRGHDYPPENVALQSMFGPWSDPWITELIDEKPLPWSGLFLKKIVADGDWVATYFGVNYGLASIRRTPQRIHVLGQWRRKAERPTSMRDIGTLDMRIGFNQTQIGNDGAGVISEQGLYQTYQDGNKLIMLARPSVPVISAQAGEHAFGAAKLPAQEIRSVQCTAALFNYELPAPKWDVYVDDQKVVALPATARFGQVITIHDGVTYLALRPLPTDDLGRDVEVSLEPGLPQAQAYHEGTRIQPALLINAYFYKQATALPPAALEKLKGAMSGFVVELGDASEYGSFETFQAHIREAKLSSIPGPDGAPTVTYRSGIDTLVARWPGAKEETPDFTVNGKDPYGRMTDLWRDTSLTQMGRARLEKNGAVIERPSPEKMLLLQTFPKQKIYVAMNLLPNYQSYSFHEPGGVKIVADGACSMGRWAVKNSHEIDIKYLAFGGEYLPKDKEPAPATRLFISGTKAKPQVMLNGKDVTASLKSSKQDGVDGWLVSLAGAPL